MTEADQPGSSRVLQSVTAFGEDTYHRIVIGVLIERVAEEMNVAVKTKWRNSSRGHGRVATELKQYLRGLRDGEELPDFIVVVMDANKKGWRNRMREIPRNAGPVPVVRAVPDPHIECWLMLDNEAFRDLFGRGFQTPKKNPGYNRDFYKRALFDAYAKTGPIDNIRVFDRARKIASKINLTPTASGNKSLERFLKELRDTFQQISPSR